MLKHLTSTGFEDITLLRDIGRWLLQMRKANGA